MAHLRPPLALLVLLWFTLGCSWCAEESPLASVPGWLEGLRELVEGTKGRPLDIQHGKGKRTVVVKAEMDGPEVIKGTLANGEVVRIPLREVHQMQTVGALKE